jgi:hypothetical protein
MARPHLTNKNFCLYLATTEPSSFCKCTCFSNSTIIELRPINTDKDLSDGLLERGAEPGWNFDDYATPEIDTREDSKDDNEENKNKQTTSRNRALTCNDCNRAFCLDYNLPKCKGAKEEDVIATCFRMSFTLELSCGGFSRWYL